MVSYPKVALAVSIGAPDLSCIPCIPKFKVLSNFFQEFCSRLSTHVTYTCTNAYMYVYYKFKSLAKLTIQLRVCVTNCLWLNNQCVSKL